MHSRLAAEQEAHRATQEQLRTAAAGGGSPAGRGGSRVTELQLQSEYQLRMKDMNMNEKIKDLTDRFTLELEQAQTKFELLLQEKNEQEMEFEERLRQTDEKNAKETRQLENQFQEQILVEVERYKNLQRDKDLLNEQWDEETFQNFSWYDGVNLRMMQGYEKQLKDNKKWGPFLRTKNALRQQVYDDLKPLIRKKRMGEELTAADVEKLVDLDKLIFEKLVK